MASSGVASHGDEDNLFYACTKDIFSNWTALKYAVQTGQGGVNSAIKAEWMVGVVYNFFFENDDLYPDEVEDFIADILNAEFDAIAEDGSVLEISQKLCKFFRLYRECNYEDLLAYLNTTSKRVASTEELKMSSDPETNTNTLLETRINELSLKSNSRFEQESANGCVNRPEHMDSSDCTDDSEQWQTVRSQKK